MSPLLRDILDDVEVDNDASILRKMEQIVNQYKARVEGLLAKEGKTLEDDDWKVSASSPSLKTTVAASNVSSSSSRRRSIGSTLMQQQQEPASSMMGGRGRDASSSSIVNSSSSSPGSPLPSRIPKPLLFVFRHGQQQTPKETCL